MSSDSEQTGYTEEEISTIEAVLFSSPRPLPTNDLKKLLSSRHKGGVKGIVDKLNQKYAENDNTFRIREIAGGLQFYLIPDYAIQVEKYFSVQRNRRLTPAGLETLAIIAYKQPTTKGEIEQIRGVASDGVIQTLLERKLIKPAGRAERVGKPLLYATTTNFLEYFGITSLDQLPKLAEMLPRPTGSPLQKSLDFRGEDMVTEDDPAEAQESET
ncbi:MAG: SMC-Scp complex subunit ScpB [candidate division Zixibacteria bacterium]|nr:SMC-Scp complex subunit ScpB [candidate division Zixibacteria bacterium]